ncbi:hypothetical protein HS088_TW19G00708 [Tripterygium wilfordii]|uniref:Uncharacterized protein n=1 Tax=Tripterygium wilfordii TaxID=458696 RepID=A0A7J7CAA7_TRIWF|nr:zinc finger A20 and AN1 domain-containing stress-associated protein 5-like [Tripterygium wilfordii]KAF5731104.1 hypothetical protein HS088_TW19G00708 [Tripterygium wilfordii]
MDPPLCAKGCGFYGTVENQNMCSKCFKEFQKKQELRDPTVKAETEVGKRTEVARDYQSETEETAVVNSGVEKIRCKSCRRRVGLTGFKCRCGGVFCGVHRYPEAHTCNVDLKALGREALLKENPVCKNDKLNWRI